MCSISIQIRDIESLYFWDTCWIVVLEHFKHKSCLILIKIFKSIYGSNLHEYYFILHDHNWTIFMLKIFQYLWPKYVSSRQNVLIPPICILLIHISFVAPPKFLASIFRLSESNFTFFPVIIGSLRYKLVLKVIPLRCYHSYWMFYWKVSFSLTTFVVLLSVCLAWFSVWNLFNSFSVEYDGVTFGVLQTLILFFVFDGFFGVRYVLMFA